MNLKRIIKKKRICKLTRKSKCQRNPLRFQNCKWGKLIYLKKNKMDFKIEIFSNIKYSNIKFLYLFNMSIGIRREDKGIWEQRVPITPSDI